MKDKASMVIEKDEDGYLAVSPEFQSCYAQGETYGEVIENIKDVICLHLEDMIESKETIPEIGINNLDSFFFQTIKHFFVLGIHGINILGHYSSCSI